MPKFLKENWFGLLSVLLSFFILTLLIISGGINNFIVQAKNIDVRFLILAFVGIIFYCLFDTCVLFCLVKMRYKVCNFFSCLKACLISLFYSAITPLSIGGQPMQVMYLNKKSDIKIGDASLFVIIKMLLYQIATIIYAIIGFFLSKNFMNKRITGMVFLGFFLNIIFVLSVIVICLKKEWAVKLVSCIIDLLSRIKIFGIKDKKAVLKKMTDQIDLFNASGRIIYQKKFDLVLIFLLNIIELTFYYFISGFVFKSFGINYAIHEVIFMISLIYMTTSFVPIPGASGATEGVFYIFFKSYFSRQTVLPIIFVWRLISYYFLILLGGLVIIFDMIKRD